MKTVATQIPARAGGPDWNRLWMMYGRTAALLLAMVVGFLIPQAEGWAVLLQYLLMVMLFFSFLDIVITRESFHASLILILLANAALPVAWFLLIRGFNRDLALTAFITAAAPTATATPVVIHFIRARVDYTVTAVLLTNIGMAILLPFLLPWAAGGVTSISTAEVLPPVLEVMFVPLVLAWLARRLPAGAQAVIRKGKPVSFPVWLLVLFLVTSKASSFLHGSLNISSTALGEIALISLLTCVVNFVLGWWLGGETFHREASQSLGQKNNSFTVWIALTFINPLTALGPTFYVAYHNLYNAFQLYLAERGRTAHEDNKP
jgi:BASS family bile acid:Na+ symporter